jgi:hypothetical protein
MEQIQVSILQEFPLHDFKFKLSHLMYENFCMIYRLGWYHNNNNAIKKEILSTYTWVVFNKGDTSPTLVYTNLHQDCNKNSLKSCMQPWEGEYLHFGKKKKIKIKSCNGSREVETLKLGATNKSNVGESGLNNSQH